MLGKTVQGRVLAVLSLAILAGCTIVQNPISTKEREAQAATDRGLMFVDQEPLDGPLTLFDVMARTIKYNLDHRMKALEEAVALRQIDVANFNLCTAGGGECRLYHA